MDCVCFSSADFIYVLVSHSVHIKGVNYHVFLIIDCTHVQKHWSILDFCLTCAKIDHQFGENIYGK